MLEYCRHLRKESRPKRGRLDELMHVGHLHRRCVPWPKPPYWRYAADMHLAKDPFLMGVL